MGRRGPNRLKTSPKVRPLDPDKPMAPYRVPPPPAGKFRHIPGQLAMDLFSDDPDALVELDRETAP
jgi:hypothetical protein